MSSLSNSDKQILENILEMDGGYVLDFSNRSFQDFIKTAVGINIYDDKYEQNSGSKANRLRAFWDIEDDKAVGKLILELVEYARNKAILSNEDLGAKDELFEKIRQRAEELAGQRKSDTEGVSDLRDIELTEPIIDNLNLAPEVNKVIVERIGEIRKCVGNDIPLATIFLCGSTLEGLLLEVARKRRDDFLATKAAPKRKGKVIPVEEWTLNDLINTSYELGILHEDVKRHTQELRHFRNYIHPREQSRERFSPTRDTSAISWKVLKAAINQISKSYET